MSWVLVALLMLLVFVDVALIRQNRRLRKRLKRKKKNFPCPIPRIRIDELDPIFRVGPHGPGHRAAVRMVGRADLPVEGGVSDEEAWVLGALAKGAHRIFEFGTCTGRTTWILAENSPADARVGTLTLASGQHGEYEHEAGDDATARDFALAESRFDEFYYTGTSVEGKVDQIFGDSKHFDESEWVDRCDLVFVDGSHAYSYVLSDSRKAIRMVKPGGLVLWHDYRGPYRRDTLDVYRALNELAREWPLAHVRSTAFAAYRRAELSV